MRNMKSSKMRSGFTMIELIFVIVVLGILAAVAMPKFVNVQDDAKVSSEKSTVGAIRSAIGMLHGKAIIKNGDFSVKFTAPDATTATLLVTVTNELYPVGLTVEATPASANTTTAKKDAIGGDYIPKSAAQNIITDGGNQPTLAVVLDLEGRKNWATGALEANKKSDKSGTAQTQYDDASSKYAKMLLEGPATYKTGVKDDQDINEFEIDSDGVWEYDSLTGTIIYRKGWETADDGTITVNALNYESATTGTTE